MLFPFFFAYLGGVLLLAVLLWYLSTRTIESFTEASTTPLPKKIWCYWNHDTDIPEVVQKCIQNWKRMNPDHEVTMIQPHNQETYIPSASLPPRFTELEPQRQADWIRLYLLREYGGFWIDSSTILTKSLSWIHEKQVAAYGFYIRIFTTQPSYPVLENWFLAAAPKHPFLTAWFTEYDRICRIHGNNGDAYVEELKKTYGEETYAKLLQKIEGPGYLSMHMAAQKLMQVDHLPSYVCDVAEEGPYYILARGNWDSYAFIQKITEPYTDPFVPPLIKMRGRERTTLIEYLKTHTPDPQSIYARYLEETK